MIKSKDEKNEENMKIKQLEIFERFSHFLFLAFFGENLKKKIFCHVIN